jgi:hypothetical protein
MISRQYFNHATALPKLIDLDLSKMREEIRTETTRVEISDEEND